MTITKYVDKRLLDEALAQNVELVAQLKMIRKIFRDESLSPLETMRKLPMVIDLGPSQCLRDHDAEVARAGFVAGTKLLMGDRETNADDYAEKIRRGE